MKVSYTFARRLTQLVFLAACLMIAFQFLRFAGPLEHGRLPSVQRPPGVEAFLPISALVSLKSLIATGQLNRVHPSAVLILGFALAASFMVRKSFCSWACPLGLLSEMLFLLKRRTLGRRCPMPRLPDAVLKRLKYLVLGFFVYIIFFKMGDAGLLGFIYSPSHIVADIKMLEFFRHMSPSGITVFLTLTGLSFVFPFFWCRYLCPYGALMGLAGMIGPAGIRREAKSCTGCGRCDRACPAHIRISARTKVRSDVCTSCGRCADACPHPGTLAVSAGRGRKAVPAAVIAVTVVLIFLGGSLAARRAGVWQNGISGSGYLSAMLETGLLSPDRVDDMGELIRHLDARGKRVLMMQMVRNEKTPHP